MIEIVNVAPGECINRAFAQALKVAQEHQNPVQFEFNERTYTISENDTEQSFLDLFAKRIAEVRQTDEALPTPQRKEVNYRAGDIVKYDHRLRVVVAVIEPLIYLESLKSSSYGSVFKKDIVLVRHATDLIHYQTIKKYPTINAVAQLDAIADEIHSIDDLSILNKLWTEYFNTYLTSIGFNKTSIKHLFEWGNGGHNWSALHLENTEYKYYTKEKLIAAFKSEVSYIWDRMSLDRLFRAHWLLNQANINLPSTI